MYHRLPGNVIMLCRASLIDDCENLLRYLCEISRMTVYIALA